MADLGARDIMHHEMFLLLALRSIDTVYFIEDDGLIHNKFELIKDNERA